jgi:hypothetical protein
MLAKNFYESQAMSGSSHDEKFKYGKNYYEDFLSGLLIKKYINSPTCF